MAWRPHPRRARTDPSSPRAWATSDRSGFVDNLENMVWQTQWRGTKLIKTGLLVSPEDWDVPQRQLGTVILPPDPVAVRNARPENYPIDEIWPRLLQGGQPRYLQRSECSRSMQASFYETNGNI